MPLTDTPANPDSPPSLEILQPANGQACATLSGNWTLSQLTTAPELQAKIKSVATDKTLQWNMNALAMLDNASALMLWQAWGEQIPAGLLIRPEHQKLFDRWQAQQLPKTPPPNAAISRFLDALQTTLKSFYEQVLALLTLLGQLALDIGYLIVHPTEIPWAEISGTIYESGVRALGITALVGFLIGIVLSYLSALQLKIFGAEIYIIDILGLSIIRELGPLLAAILVAGRSGSAMTAQIGIMRVTEELDALSAMGIAHSMRLILPKVTALTISMPLLSIWTSTTALIGGMYSAQTTLDISYQQFFLKLPDVVPIANVFIGLGKSAVFGLMIALIACHFGFRIKPNTESLGNETTNSVVVAITVVIMIDAIFAILFMGVGMP
ncbi:MAG: ABC transporter permease [Methylococcaceae bacterium]|nr:ABC transporter permease [Methylococcaceae bacterium]